jgi:hypothetical protein
VSTAQVGQAANLNHFSGIGNHAIQLQNGKSAGNRLYFSLDGFTFHILTAHCLCAGSILLVDSGNFRMKIMGGVQGATRYPQRIIAGTGSELRGGVPFPSTFANAHEAALGQVLGLTADTRRSRNATQDVYFTERVSNVN